MNPRKIQPGERYKSRQILILDLDKVFPQPGSYQIQAVLHDVSWQEEIKSNLLTIHIAEPAGLDLQAFEYIKKYGNPSYFFTGLKLRDEQAQIVLREFVSNFNETAYWDYAADMLAGLYFSKKEYEKAIKLWERVAEKPSFVFADEALYRLIETKAKLRAFGEARHYLAILSARYPGSDYIEKAEIFISQESRKNR